MGMINRKRLHGRAPFVQPSSLGLKAKSLQFYKLKCLSLDMSDNPNLYLFVQTGMAEVFESLTIKQTIGILSCQPNCLIKFMLVVSM